MVPNCLWRIDPATKTFYVEKFDTGSPVTVAAGQVGHAVGEDGKDYRLIQDELSFSTEGVVTACIVQGMDKTVEIIPPVPGGPGSSGDAVMIPAWEAADAVGWTMKKWGDGEYEGVPGKALVNRTWKARSHDNRRWAGQQGTIVVNDQNIVRFYGGPVVTLGSLYTNAGRLNGGWNVASDYGTITFQEPQPQLAGTTLYFWGRVLGPNIMRYPDPNPPYNEPEYIGTAYDDHELAVEKVLIVPSMEHPTSRLGTVAGFSYGGFQKAWCGDIRDDRTWMRKLAQAYVEANNSEKIAGDITVHGAGITEYITGKRVKIGNLAKWATINFLVAQITVRPMQDVTILSVANVVQAIAKYDFSYDYQRLWAEREQMWHNIVARKLAQYGIHLTSPFANW
jgi:hypothetical protein